MKHIEDLTHDHHFQVSDYDRNLILRLHNKLLKFPELKQFAK